MLYIITYLNKLDKHKEIDIKADSAREAERQFKITHPTCDLIQKITVREET